MAVRTSFIRCDYCETQEEFRDEDIPVEQGWLELAKYDMISEEVRHYDFCSSDCLISHLE